MAEELVVVISAKDEASKVIRGIDKQMEGLLKQKAAIEVSVDDKDAAKKLATIDKALASMDKQKAEIEVDAKVTDALRALDEVSGEAKRAEAAAEALGRALGPELSGRVDVSQLVGDFQRMGLSLDEIAAKADTLGSKIRSIDAQGAGNLDETLGRSRRGVDDLGRSADSSKSALANMIGNSAQDLGSLGGQAGSAGVAIGQMAEYMADAALEGGKMGTVLADFGKVAIPIAAITVAVSAVGSIFQDMADRAARAKELVKDFADTTGDLDKTRDAVKGLTDDLSHFDADARTAFGGFVEGVAAAAKSIPVLGGLVGDAGQNVTDVLAVFNKLGIHADDVAKAIDKQGDAWDGLLVDLLAAKEAGLITSAQYAAAVQVLQQYRDAQIFAGKATEFNGKAAEDNTEKIKAESAALEQAGQDLQSWAKQLADTIISALKASDDLGELGSTFAQMGAGTEALQSIFDLGNAPLKFLGDVRDIDQGMRDLATFINDPKGLKGAIPNIFDPNDVNADDFLSKIASLRGPIQQQIDESFSTGGAEAAKQTGENFVNELFAVLKGKLSKDQIRTLLGLDNIDVKLKVAVDQKSLDNAKKELDIFSGISGLAPPEVLASLKLAVDSGDLSGDALRVILQRISKNVPGLVIPSSLQVPDAGQAKRDADAWMAANKITVGVGSTLENPSAASKVAAANDAQAWATGNPVVFPSSIAPPRVPRNIFSLIQIPGLDAGGTMPDSGGVVGERRPEIVNSRYLITQPTLVPGGTRVTSGARTARILRSRGTRGLRRYDAGGVVKTGPSVVNVNINGAALGARYDIMRTVRRAAKDAARIIGTRS